MTASALLSSTPASFDSAMTALKGAPVTPPAGKDVDAAAKSFEGVFVSEMLSHMFEGVSVDPEFGGGHGEEAFRGMLIDQYGKMISNGPGIGISSAVKAMMIKMQQSQQHQGA